MIESDEHVKLLKEELSRNEETISSLRSRNIDITIRLISYIHGVSVGDVVCVPNGTEYKVCEVAIDRWLFAANATPWVVGNPHTKDGTGWDMDRRINLYANWRRI